MLKKSLGLAAIASVAFASSAMAGGLTPAPAEPVVSAPAPFIAPAPAGDPWTGFTLGAGVGYGNMNNVLEFGAQLGADEAEASIPILGGNGGLLTLEAAYNMRIGANFVAGAQLDWTGTNIAGTGSFSATDGVDTIEGTYTNRTRNMLTAALRAGYLPTESTLVYGLVGATRGNFNGNGSIEVNGVTVADTNYNYRVNGLTLGAGIQTMVADNMSLKMEYRHTQFRRNNIFSEDLGGGDFISLDHDTTVQTIRAVVAFHF